MAEVVRREVVYVLTAIVVLIMIADYFLAVPEIKSAAAELKTWATIISTMALTLGAVNIIRVHGRNVRRRAPGIWYHSAFLIFIFAFLTILGLTNIDNPSANPVYKWIFDNAYVSLGQTWYAITGFYIASAAYRAFRARNIDAALLLIAGIFVMLLNAPIGEVIWVQIPVIGRWFNDIGQMPAMRTFLIVAAFGILAFGFRTLLGRERGFYGEVAGG